MNAPRLHRCGWTLVNGGCVNPEHRKPGQCTGCGGHCDGRHLDKDLLPKSEETLPKSEETR